MPCGCRGSQYQPPERFTTQKAAVAPSPQRKPTDTQSPAYYHTGRRNAPRPKETSS